MLTPRGWWFFLIVLGLLSWAVCRGQTVVALLGLTLLLWFAWEWLLFNVRMRFVVPRLDLEREVRDERGPVATLWAGRTFQVRVALCAPHWPGLPYLQMTDRLPFEVEMFVGERQRDGAVVPGRPLGCAYSIRCRWAGRVRFEGLTLRFADLQGFFYHTAFLRKPIEYRVLPPLADAGGHTPTVKRHNLLPPPGVHRLRRPGSGSELLDLRDYLPGDPPKTIAWKPSARRDRLITKEFESEVPVRCTLLIDTSSSVRIGPPGQNALGRLVEIAAAVTQATASARDLTGICLLDEQAQTWIRPARGQRHVVHVLNVLADAASLAPTTASGRLTALVPLAHAFAEEVYPDLMRPDLNRVPFWLPWLWPQPAYTVREPTLADRLNQRLPILVVLFGALAGLAILVIFGITVQLFFTMLRQSDNSPYAEGPSPWLIAAMAALLLGELLAGTGLVLLLIRKLPLFFPGRRRLYRWRKRLAAVLSVRYGLAPGGLARLLEDDEQMALLVQRFLAEHHVPYPLPLYDRQGRYLFAAPAKVEVLAQGLLRAVGKGHDNELFVLLVDLLELSDHLGPLLRAVKVALARHHQVVVVCPWPPSVPPPTGRPDVQEHRPTVAALARRHLTLRRATTVRMHRAYQQLRWTFARLGVQVVCAQSDDPVPLVLDRINRLRAQGRTQGGRR